jgi:hypothetical protein
VINRNVTVNRVSYMYENHTEAVTAVRREDFVAARSVSQVSVKVTPEQVQRARPVEGAEALAPTRQSYVAANAKVAPQSARPAVAFNDRKVVAKINPPIPAACGHEPRIVNAEKPAAPAGPPPNRGNSAQQQQLQQPPAVNRVVEPPQHGNAPEQVPSRPAIVTPPPQPQHNQVEPYRSRGNLPDEKPQQQQKVQEQHPAVRYTPPVKAKDEMYDVHPPLNKKAEAPPPREEKRAEPPPKQEKQEKPQKEDKKTGKK